MKLSAFTAILTAISAAWLFQAPHLNAQQAATEAEDDEAPLTLQLRQLDPDEEGPGSLGQEALAGSQLALRQTLVELLDLEASARLVRWQPRGFEGRVLSDLLHDESAPMSAAINLLGERLARIGGRPETRPRALARASDLSPLPETLPEARDLAAMLQARFDIVARRIRRRAALTNANDIATNKALEQAAIVTERVARKLDALRPAEPR